LENNFRLRCAPGRFLSLFGIREQYNEAIEVRQ